MEKWRLEMTEYEARSTANKITKNQELTTYCPAVVAMPTLTHHFLWRVVHFCLINQCKSLHLRWSWSIKYNLWLEEENLWCYQLMSTSKTTRIGMTKVPSLYLRWHLETQLLGFRRLCWTPDTVTTLGWEQASVKCTVTVPVIATDT